MNLYKRNFLNGLTSEEEAEYNAILTQEQSATSGRAGRILLSKEYPIAARHYYSLFPNQHFVFDEAWDAKDFHQINDAFLSLISDSSCRERQILNYINHTPAFHIVAAMVRSICFVYDHMLRWNEVYLFPEFPLGTDWIADYLIIVRSSGGYELIFVEFESPYGNITTSDGSLGNTFIKGLRQIDDWKMWLESNYSTLESYFEHHAKRDIVLPREFHRYDSSRIHFVVVAGRRKDFSDKTYRIAREYRNQHRTQLFHYDRLYNFIYPQVHN